MSRLSLRPFFVVLVLSYLTSSCGGGGSPTTPTAPPPPDAVRTVLDTKTFSLQPGTATYKNIDLPPAGVLDGTVDWAGGNDINLYVTDNSCPGLKELQAGGCNVVARADSPTAKPERVSFTTPAGRIWTFWIHNNGAASESGSLEVGVTTQGPPPAPAPTPTPNPSNPSDPRANLPDGPVVRYTIKVRSIDTGNFDYRDPYQDEDGNWIVFPGEFVVFDSTQKNANGDVCKWKDDPAWKVTDPDGVFSIRGSSNPFLLRVDINRKGSVVVQASIDGVESNVLYVLSKKK